jgi:hypothetical protein
MNTKSFIIPILVVALVGVIAAPPVQAEFVTLSIILAAAFGTAVVANETVRSEPDSQTAATPDRHEPVSQAPVDYAVLAPASR